MKNRLIGLSSPYLTTEYLLNLYADYSSPHHKIKALADNHDIRRIKKGLYVIGEHYQRPYSKEVLSGMIFGPSAISFEYALSYYSLIPEKVETITCLCFKRDKSFDTPAGHFLYKYIDKKIYNEKVNYKQTDLGNFFIASKEKALCDLAYFQKIESIESAYEYILEDLRIDRNEVLKLNINDLIYLKGIYKRPSVINLIDAIIKIKNETKG